MWTKVISVRSPSLVHSCLVSYGPDASICVPWPTALPHFTGIPHWWNQTAVTKHRKRNLAFPLTQLADHPTTAWPSVKKHTFKESKEEQLSNLQRVCSVVCSRRNNCFLGFGAFLWAFCWSSDCDADLYLCFSHVFLPPSKASTSLFFQLQRRATFLSHLLLLYSNSVLEMTLKEIACWCIKNINMQTDYLTE